MDKKMPSVICSAFMKKDGKFLIVYDPRFREWRVPGGRIDWGEKIEDTVVREMKEETQIDIKDPKFLGLGQDQDYKYSKDKKTFRLILYFYTEVDKEPVLDPVEASECKWVTLDELKNMENKEGALKDFFERNPELEL